MNAKHTPGPWDVERRFSCWAITDGKGQDLTYQDDAPRFYAGEPCGNVTSRGRTEEELSANARLIAAAPELLAVCDAFIDEFERGREWISYDTLDRAVRAYRKATGCDHA